MAALFSELSHLRRLRGLVWVLTLREVAARYQGSAAGVLWAYVQPLLTVAAYYLVFDVVFAMRLGDNAPTGRVGTYLIVGSLPWMAFCDAVGRGTSSLIEAGGLLHKNALPPVLFPARTVLASTVVYGPLLLLLALAYAPVHRFALPVLAVLPLLLLQALLAFLLAYALAIMAAALRDVVQLVGFALSIGIFISPVLFPMALFPPAWRWVLWANPMTPVVAGLQSALLQGAWPPAQVWAALALWIMALAALLSLLVPRSRDQLVDWL
ncbi:ABC transporter permease [Melaminivora alkalimesophila]|uniref:Transport permease protein n=1 Tax=Melaminivora alkalimesophila TaxID=1165852 RepID=A0A317R880_9BURK|nr:ABC transporter permease [Melaminivora alkalimesophila]PWW43739.1 lipopolysaccharide transport system permease protein [Melaminivora alkalimesophila]